AGVLAVFGVDPVPVVRRALIGVISTGNELVVPLGNRGTGQVRNANSSLLISFLYQAGAIPVFYGIVLGEAQALSPVLAAAAAECDLVIVSAGVPRMRVMLPQVSPPSLVRFTCTGLSVSRVSVGILPTGTELILPGEQPLPGQVVESNTKMVDAYLREFGGG
ncbi:MAG: molybdopterin-binding protein, partial [Methanocorpusculum sp.]|nr:molybdopterin-binding protein [Methanocorpusculum sp.]